MKTNMAQNVMVEALWQDAKFSVSVPDTTLYFTEPPTENNYQEYLCGAKRGRRLPHRHLWADLHGLLQWELYISLLLLLSQRAVCSIQLQFVIGRIPL
jgi:hypothetical protein